MGKLRYSEDSWLGETPSSWQIFPAKVLFSNPVEKSHQNDIHLTPSQKYGVLPQSDYMEITGNRVVLNLSGADNMRHVESGDYVSHLRSFQGGLEFSSFAGKVSSAYTVLRPRREIDHRFYKYLFKSSRYVQGLATTTEQLRDGQSIRYEQFALLPLPNPPLETQKAIADFLDRELSTISEALTRQNDLVRLLRLRRQATIDESITEYPAGATFKPCRLKDVANIFASNVDKKIYDDGTSISLCNYVDVYYNDFISEDLPFMQATATKAEISKFSLKRNWVLLTKDSESELDIGISAYVENDLPGVVCGYHLAILEPKNQIDGLFLKWVLDSTSAKTHFARRANGLTRMALGRDAIATLPLRIPTLEHQRLIADKIKESTREIDKLIRESNKLTALLHERRNSLVSEAVTGKIDVRGKN